MTLAKACAAKEADITVRTLALQENVLLTTVDARSNGLFILPDRLRCPQCCNTVA